MLGIALFLAMRLLPYSALCAKTAPSPIGYGQRGFGFQRKLFYKTRISTVSVDIAVICLCLQMNEVANSGDAFALL